MSDPTQYMTALDKANAIRFARAALRRRIKAGELTLPDVLDPHVQLEEREEIEYAIANMPLEKLVTAAVRVGSLRYVKLWQGFSRNGPARKGLKISDLSDVRRTQFAAYLRAKGI